MRNVAAAVGNIVITVFVVSSMLTVGLGNKPVDVVRPLRRPSAPIRVVLANFVLVPALAWLAAKGIQLEEPLTNGLILTGAAAGSPFLIKLSEAAAARVDLTAALFVMLLPLTVIYMPLALPLLLPEAHVPAGSIVVPLLLTMLLPLAAGLLARALWTSAAIRVQPVTAKLSTLALILVIASTVAANYMGVVEVGWRGAVAAIIVVGGAFLIGYSLGTNRHRREVLGLGTAQRHIGAAIIVASQSFDEPEAVVMVIATSLISLAVLFPIAHVLRRRERVGHRERSGDAAV